MPPFVISAAYKWPDTNKKEKTNHSETAIKHITKMIGSRFNKDKSAAIEIQFSISKSNLTISKIIKKSPINMKKVIQIIAIVFFISCKQSASKIEINDVEKHRAYQDSAIAKVKTPAEKFEVLKTLISEYVNLPENKKNNTHYNYYLGRLYSMYADFPFNGFLYDTTYKKLNDPILYSNYIDSSVYFNEMSLKLDSNNLFAFYTLVRTLLEDQLHLEQKIHEYSSMPNYSKRHNIDYQRNMNYIHNNSLRFLAVDTSKDKFKSRYGIEFAKMTLSNTIQNANYDYNDINLVNSILIVGKYIVEIDKFPDLVLLSKEYYKKDKIYWQPIIAKANAVYDKLHEWDDVTYEQFHNCEQSNLWIYSNGKYKLEHYEQDISTLPYDDRMNVNSYDLMCCTVPGAKKYIKFKSEGDYKKQGMYYYFYPNRGSSNVVGGFDPDKNARYMKLNGWGNLEFLREDFETVIFNKR
jgi:hypothetical protein